MKVKNDLNNDVMVMSKNIAQHLTAFNLEERRLFISCVEHYDSRPETINPEQIIIPIDDFKRAFPPYANYPPSVFQKKITEAVFGIDAKGYRPDLKEDYKVRWFANFDLEELGFINLVLTPESMPFFINIRDNFIKYKMVNVGLIRKPTTWNLYEYIKEELGAFSKKTWKVDIDVLKERLGVLDKYPRSSSFIDKCIQTPINEINKLTDIKVDFKRQKKGKIVVCFYFEVF